MIKLKSFPFIRCSDPDSFAAFTFENRLPKIIQEIIDSNIFDSVVCSELDSLQRNLDNILVIRLDNLFPELWNDFYLRYEKLHLKEIPFFFAEIYFYALINSITEYNVKKIDPFGEKKLVDIKNNISFFKRTLGSSDREIANFINLSLNGNKADLSQFKRDTNNRLTLLIDDSQQLVRSISNAANIHLILDNAGVELFTDLLLAKQITAIFGKPVTLHLKAEPLLVSDAIEADIHILLSELEIIGLSSFVHSFKGLLHSRMIFLQRSHFWNSPLHFNHISSLLEHSIQTNDLIISKGDANYRRFFEDRQIPSSTNSQELIDFLPCSAFAIRTLKSEIQTGLSPNQLDKLNNEHANWMISGEFGVIQKLF